MIFRIIILSLLTPVQRWMQKIGNPEPKISSFFAEYAVKNLEDGDLLLSKEDWRLTNLFVPGKWGHAAVFYQGNVIEAIGSGVRKENVHRWLYQKDSVCILRPRIKKELRSCIGTVCRAQIGKPYDYEFIADADSFYCSELYVWAHNQFCAPVAMLRFKKYMFLETSTPQALYDMRQKYFDMIAEELN